MLSDKRKRLVDDGVLGKARITVEFDKNVWWSTAVADVLEAMPGIGCVDVEYEYKRVRV
jgi:hypothetical protein